MVHTRIIIHHISNKAFDASFDKRTQDLGVVLNEFYMWTYVTEWTSDLGLYAGHSTNRQY